MTDKAEAHEARLRQDVLSAVQAFYVSIDTPRNADMARLADEALARLVEFVRARAAVEALDRLTPLCGDGAGHWCIDDPRTTSPNGGACMIHNLQQIAKAELDRLIKEANDGSV